MDCGYLHCRAEAVARVTIPQLQPQTPLCAEHRDETLTSDLAKKWRRFPGSVSVETL